MSYGLKFVPSLRMLLGFSCNNCVGMARIIRPHLCPSIARFLLNTYHDGIDLFIGRQVMSSNEGTAQGDPLGMIMYTLATMPLIQSLHSNEVVQAWCADVTSAVGEFFDLFTWWKSLLTQGPKYDYFPNSMKTHLVVKDNLMEYVKSIFGNTGVSITSSGR